MTDLLLSNDDLDRHRSSPKKVSNSRARWKEKLGRHKQRNFSAESRDGNSYLVYLRQNLDDDKDFSCGLQLVRRGAKPLSLVRYNGSSHAHGEIHYRCHIHRATAEAVVAGKKIDSYAEATDRYITLGLIADSDQPA